MKELRDRAGWQGVQAIVGLAANADGTQAPPSLSLSLPPSPSLPLSLTHAHTLALPLSPSMSPSLQTTVRHRPCRSALAPPFTRWTMSLALHLEYGCNVITFVEFDQYWSNSS